MAAAVLLLSLLGHLAPSSAFPLVVVGAPDEALAAAMALCTKDALSGPPKESGTSPVPPAQPVAHFDAAPAHSHGPRLRPSSEAVASLQNALLFLGPSMEGHEYERILAHALQLTSRISNDGGADGRGPPMLHTSIECGCDEGARAMESLYLVRDRFSCLGLNLRSGPAKPGEDERFAMTREGADLWGNKLSALLEGCRSAAVTMDVRIHLAMLQANSLPKTRGLMGENDAWAISGAIQDGMHVDSGDGLLFEYNYDYSDPFGGCDPLLRPSTGYVLPTMASSACDAKMARKASDAYAAAYSALVGSGLRPLDAISIATAVNAKFREGTMDDDGTYQPPSYTWNNIRHIADSSLKARQQMRKEDGLARRWYKEYGYR